jgi:hypothetical protein
MIVGASGFLVGDVYLTAIEVWFNKGYATYLVNVPCGTITNMVTEKVIGVGGVHAGKNILTSLFVRWHPAIHMIWVKQPHETTPDIIYDNNGGMLPPRSDDVLELLIDPDDDNPTELKAVVIYKPQAKGIHYEWTKTGGEKRYA